MWHSEIIKEDYIVSRFNICKPSFLWNEYPTCKSIGEISEKNELVNFSKPTLFDPLWIVALEFHS